MLNLCIKVFRQTVVLTTIALFNSMYFIYLIFLLNVMFLYLQGKYFACFISLLRLMTVEHYDRYVVSFPDREAFTVGVHLCRTRENCIPTFSTIC